ncbi:MAG: chitobiase/beta-hexosaminidase C-terminal domain-containing protein [Bacteroidales bacterium]|nr:chitobiase/beta-hexosaminidase C-terminal domain-containing protein [Bacteroidales bacterium]
MKKLLFILLTVATMLPWAANAQETLTVCNGTNTHTKIPVNGLYVDTQGTTSEFIIPADSLSDMVGGSISKITFYISEIPETWGTPTIQLYIGEVDGTTLSSISGPSAFTIVNTSVWSNQQSTIEVVFDSPYTYEGGNLLIGTYVQTKSSTYKSTNFYGVAAVSGASRYNNGSGDGTAQSFLPKTTFTYTPGAPITCAKPANLAATLTQGNGTIATLTWTQNGTANTWQLQTATDADFTSNVQNYICTTTTKDLTGLTAETTYYARVRANCSGSDLSDWSRTCQFKPTETQTVTIGDGTTSTAYYPISTYYNYSLTQQIYTADEIEAAGGSAGTINSISFKYAYTGHLSMSGVKLYMLNTNKTAFSSDLDMVAITDANKVWEGTFTASAAGWVKIDLDTPFEYDGGNLIVCMYDQTYGYPGNYYVFNTTATTYTSAIIYYSDSSIPDLDNIYSYTGLKTQTQYRNNIQLSILATSTPKPRNLEVSDITTEEATITWQAPTNATPTRYEYQYKYSTTPIYSGIWTTASGLSANLTHLGPNTSYDFEVRAVYAEGESDPAEISFTTESTCLPVTNITLSSVSSEEATLTWDASSSSTATGYQHQYKYSTTPTWGDSWTDATGTSAQLSYLEAKTSYDFRVRTNCNGDYSEPDSLTFRTACGSITELPWTEDFDSYTATSTTANNPWNYPNDVLPDCWDFLNRSNNSGVTPEVFITSYSNYAVSGNCLFFKSSHTTPLYAILPEFSNNISDLQINFTYRNEGASTSNGTLYVSYMTDPTDASTFNMENAVTCTQTIIKTPMEVLFANAPAGSRIAFKYQGGTSNSYYLAIDEVVVTMAPTCNRPTGLTATLTSGDGSVADLSWTETGEATNWILEYSTADDFTGATSVNVSGTPAQHITGLTAETTYYARVKADCGTADGQSEWSSTINFTPTDAYTLTVNDGTTTNQYVPVYGYYCDNYSRGQFIIPAEDLTAMQNGFINKMTFYSSNKDISWGTASFKVYCGSTDETTLSALAEWNGLEEVYSGSLSVSDNQMVITFDNPYQYLGGNLLIGVNQTVTGTYSSSTWYGVAAPEGASMGGYGEGSTINKQNFLPKTTFEYTPGTAPSCLKPTGLAVNYTGGTTAEVSWTSDATAFNIEVNGTVTNNVTSPYTLSGLTLGTVYELRVQADCGSDGTSDWTNPVTFNTDLCIPTEQCEITLALTDNYGDGWSGNAIKVVDVLTNFVLGEFTNTSAAEAHEAQIYHLAVCNGREIQFQWVAGTHASETSYTVLGPNSDTIFSGANTMAAPVNYTVNCPAGSCNIPTNVAYTSLTEVQAVFGWRDVTDGQWQFTCVAKDGTPNWTGIVPVDNNEAVITGLTANTEYDFYVRTYCSDTLQSEPVKVSFTTECYPLTTFPLTESFESTTFPPSCWDMFGDYNWSQSNNFHHSGTQAAYSYHAGDNYLITPAITLPSDGVKQLKFWSYNQWPSDFVEGNNSVLISTTGKSAADFTTTLWSAESVASYWVADSVSLETYAGQTIYIAFKYAGSNGNGWNLDEVSIDAIPVNATYNISATVNPTDAGTVTGTGEFEYNSETTLTATPADGYLFSNWTLNGEVVSTDAELTVTVTEDAAYVANFVAMDQVAAPTFSPAAGTYTSDQDLYVTINSATAGATIYYTTDGTTPTETSTVYSTPVDITETTTIKAIATAENMLPSEVAEATYTINPVYNVLFEDILHGQVTADTLKGVEGDAITLTATPEEGYHFGLWDVVDASNNPVAVTDNTFNMPASDVTVNAIFWIDTLNITATVNPTDAGMVEGTGAFEYGSDATLVATPAEGFLFSNWTLNGEVVSTNAIYDIIGIEADAAYVANFVAMGQVAAPTFSPAAGTYTSDQDLHVTINCATTGATIYYTTDGTTPSETSTVYNTPVEITETTTIKAIATAGNMLPSEVAEATYTVNPVYNVLFEDILNGLVTADTLKGFEGDAITLTATPEEGYHFGQWDVVDASNNPVAVTGNTFNMPASDVTVNAIFWIDTLNITATANPTEAGTVTGAGQYEYNTDVTLTATANEGYLFNNWTLNGESVSSSDILTFTALENAAYVANFVVMGQVAAPTFTPAAGTYTSEQDLNVSMSCTTTGATIYYTTDGTTPTQTSTVYSTPIEITETTTIKAIAMAENMLPSEVAEATYTINQVYNVYVEETDNGTIGANPSSGVEGTTITLSYTAEDGYTLKKWIVQNGSHEDITVTGNTFNMPASDVYVTAEFVPDTFTVTVVANPTAGGVITSGAGRYAYGEEVSIEFEANPGYEVNHVGMAVESDDEEESDSQLSMPAGNVTVTVYFNPATYSLTIEVGQGRLLNGFVRDNTYTYGEGYNLPGENDVEYAGHTFGGWYGNPDFSGDPITVISTDAYGDSTVYAKWTINTYNITATVNPTNAGMVEGTGEFEYGSDATLVATPLEGFLFENWTLNGEVVSTNAIYDIIGIEADAAFVANFVAMETVSAPVITPNGGTYDSENIPDITVSCETADAIIYYTTDGTDPDENSSVYDGPIIINGSTTVKVLAVAENMLPSEIVTAQFTINQVYDVNVEETDNGTVGAQPSSGVEGTTITLSYTADDGYTFKKWIVYDSNEEAVTVTGNTFDMPASDVYVSAQFVPDTFTLTIHYMYADNTQAAEDYTEQVAYGDEYSVTSPTVEGHTPSQTVVSGTMPADDYEETVFYSTNSHSLTIHYVYADNSEAHADVVNNYNFGVEYSVESPVIEGYTADITTVSGTMGNDNIEVVVTYTVNSHTLTINYVFEDESEAANTHTETLDYQEEYEVASPELATYMPDQAIVSGTMGDEDVTVTVTYTQIVMDAIDNVVVCNGISTEDITFSTPVTIGSFTYEWANDDAAIGLAETGTEGSIASFKAVNNGTEPAVANVTVTPTCTYNDMVVVGVPQTFTITVNPTLTSEFNATACDSYYWTEADTTITDEGENDYAHVFTSQYDCDSVVTLHLTLHMTPAEIVTNITNNTSCDETQPNGAISIASPAGDFEYSIDNQNWQTETEFTALAAGDYTLYARPLNSECAQTTMVSITDEIVMPDAAAAFVPGTPSFYCADATIALSGEGSSTGEDYSYAWSGPNNYEGTEMNVTVTTAADGTHSGTYTLVVTNTVTHCSSEATVDVIVNTPTTPDYLFTITTHGDAYANINEGETEVTAVFADPEVHHFLSDCNWTVTNDAQATYNAVGDYTINWTATDDCGNTATTTQTLHVTQNSCGTPIDGDNHSYPTVVLNGTCWMAANLRTTSYTDGRAVPVYYQYQSATAPNAAENVDTYGLLYDWYSAMDVARPSKATTVQGVCPTGWHIPDDDDFAAISNIDLSALRATDHWLINNADNSTGFTMLPAGQYNADKERYENLLGNAYFWSATTTNDAEATCHMADCNCSMWYVYPNSKYYGFSVRCVKNN